MGNVARCLCESKEEQNKKESGIQEGVNPKRFHHKHYEERSRLKAASMMSPKTRKFAFNPAEVENKKKTSPKACIEHFVLHSVI